MQRAKELSPVREDEKCGGAFGRVLNVIEREVQAPTANGKTGIERMNYEKLYSLKNLYEAHKKAKRGKRGKKEVINYELNLAYNLCRTAERLKNGSYSLGKYKEFKVYEPKERLIQALHYNDRIVQHVLCDNLLTPYLENRLTEDNVACRRGKGTHFGIKRLTEQLRRHYKNSGTKGWFLKADIRKFFANIDHGVLKSMLAREKFDEPTLKLLFKIIDSYNAETGKGLPIGNQTSQNFGLFYLDKLDRYIKEQARIKLYVRYMDDMILVDESKEKLEQTLEGMRRIAEGVLKLEFNEKTQITPLCNGIDFLGWHFYLTDSGKVIRKLRQSSKRRIFARLKKLQKDYVENRIDLKDIDQSLASIRGHLRQGSTNRLLLGILKRFVLQRKIQEDDG